MDRGWDRPEQTVVEQKKEPGLVAMLQQMQTTQTEENEEMQTVISYEFPEGVKMAG